MIADFFTVKTDLCQWALLSPWRREVGVVFPLHPQNDGALHTSPTNLWNGRFLLSGFLGVKMWTTHPPVTLRGLLLKSDLPLSWGWSDLSKSNPKIEKDWKVKEVLKWLVAGLSGAGRSYPLDICKDAEWPAKLFITQKIYKVCRKVRKEVKWIILKKKAYPCLKVNRCSWEEKWWQIIEVFTDVIASYISPFVNILADRHSLYHKIVLLCIPTITTSSGRELWLPAYVLDIGASQGKPLVYVTGALNYIDNTHQLRDGSISKNFISTAWETKTLEYGWMSLMTQWLM